MGRGGTRYDAAGCRGRPYRPRPLPHGATRRAVPPHLAEAIARMSTWETSPAAAPTQARSLGLPEDAFPHNALNSLSDKDQDDHSCRDLGGSARSGQPSPIRRSATTFGKTGEELWLPWVAAGVLWAALRGRRQVLGRAADGVGGPVALRDRAGGRGALCTDGLGPILLAVSGPGQPARGSAAVAAAERVFSRPQARLAQRGT